MLAPLPIVDVTTWRHLYPETRGNRPKRWIEGPDGTPWLRKGPRPSRPSELAIEVAMLRLAIAASLPAPDSNLAVWTEADGRAERGIIVRNFLRSPPHLQTPTIVRTGGAIKVRWPPDDPSFLRRPDGTIRSQQRGDDRFATGAEILEGVVTRYDRRQHVLHTPATVYQALGYLDSIGGGALLRTSMAMLLLFDAWIGNGDRHQENWGLIFDTAVGVPQLAHVYDPAACLGGELQDNHPLLQGRRPEPERIAKYIVGCPSGFGDQQSLIKQPALVAAFTKWPEFVGAHHLLERFENLRDTFVDDLFRSVPDGWLSPWRKRLAVVLLRERLLWLKKAIQ